MKNIIIFAIVAVALVVVFAVPRWKQAQRTKKFDDYFEKQHGALGKTTEEILSHENATNAFTVLGALHWRIGQKVEARGESSLTDTERRLLAVYWVEAEVNNGGFDQYFFNSAGDNAEAALAGLKEMGAAGAAALLEQAMAVFPGGKPPADRFKRQEVMQQIAAQGRLLCVLDFARWFRAARCRPLRQPGWLPLRPQINRASRDAGRLRQRPARF